MRDGKTNLLAGQQFGSTGSVNSYTGSDNDREPDGGKSAAAERSRLYQAAGHHLALHAVHNTSYQSTNSTLETCLESDENDLDDLTDVQL